MTQRLYTDLDVRGVIYADAHAVAAAFGITASTVRDHARAGTLDRCGLGNEGKTGQFQPKPFVIGPLCFASLAEASRALGFGRNYINRANKTNSLAMQERILGAAMRYARHLERFGASSLSAPQSTAKGRSAP
ncbi:hypothetical protein [Pseudaestuariivita rosea]|uniref:hypothetical protein n=1 Tax=Pseudaestuariivita rosea TaxID=2763263 RepID=UPI001ABBAB84|nr:hypothetical protein [Pseudaestuariivita rosea]